MNLIEQQKVCKHMRQIYNKSKSSMKLPYNRALLVFVFAFVFEFVQIQIL